MPKYSRYQDYVIRDGRLIGEFERLYQDYEDPWHEATSEEFASDKAAGINLLLRLKHRHGIKSILEVGCGFGHFSARVAATGLRAVGIDISPTAISIARARHGSTEFHVGTIDEYDLIRRLQPDVIVMAEVTWYVLESLRRFIEFLRSDLPKCYVLHLLTTYPEGVQTYGNEYFVDLEGIRRYFGMFYLESGLVNVKGRTRTWFLGTWNDQAARDWLGSESSISEL